MCIDYSPFEIDGRVRLGPELTGSTGRGDEW